MNLLVEELLSEAVVNKNNFDINKIEIKFNNTCDPEFIKLFEGMRNNPYTRFNKKESAHGVCTFKENNKDQIPIQKIYYDGKLIGFSFPRKLNQQYYTHLKIDPKGKDYYKVGSFYIDTKYRGLGIGKYVGIQFKKKYKNIVYTPKDTNTRSIGVAKAMGLKLTHSITVGRSTYMVYMN